MDYLSWTLRTIVPISSYSFLPTPQLLGDDATMPIIMIGVDTGMGKEATIRLVKESKHRIYAGCFSQKGTEDLKQITGLRGIFQIDVTSQSSVEEAVAYLNKQEPDGVFCVCNVAGAMMGGPIEWSNFDIFEKEMNLNYFGLLRVMRAFIPLLRKNSARGKPARFVAVTSTIALMPSFPGLAGYASSKSAADTLLNCLRLEIEPFGIDVINICPGITKTPFLTGGPSNQEKAWAAAPQHVKDVYGTEYAKWWANSIRFGTNWLASSPHDAISSLVDATSSRWPKTRYYTGLDSRLLARWAVHLPDFLWDPLIKNLILVLGRPALPFTKQQLVDNNNNNSGKSQL
jgi:NAD(P)-dependent dehydrogenase (short-subunit alcohol dehydrogenase family)